MPDAEAFLQAILADPDADGPRLVYADWLDEHGDPVRAEFIRTQIALARMREDDPRRPALASREEALQPAVREGWIRDYPDVVPDRLRRWFRLAGVPLEGGVGFERGMPESIAVGVESLDDVDAMFRVWPIRQVKVSSPRRDEVSQLAAWPRLSRVTKLAITEGRLYQGGMEELVGSPYLTDLREFRLRLGLSIGPQGATALALSDLRRLECLELDEGHIGPTGAMDLAQWPALVGVTRLDLPENDLGDTGVEALFGSAYLGRLTRLNLSCNDIAVAGTRALARAERLSELEDLNLVQNPLGDEGAAALASSPYLRRLRTLDLSYTRCGPSGVDALTRLASPGAAGAVTNLLGSVEVLKLRRNPLGDAGIAQLALSRCLQRLRDLDLSQTECGPAGAAALSRSESFESLIKLRMWRNPLGAEGMAALAAWPGLARLTGLDLTSCAIGDDGLRALAASPYLRRLTWLGLSSNGLGSGGIRALADSTGLESLATLALGFNNLDAEAARELARWPGLARLKNLHLAGNQIGDEGAEALARSRYVARVARVNLSSNGVTAEGDAPFAAAGLTNLVTERTGRPRR
jgi:uncharacterized protein (TIGR02996 family)